jgi:hypothetical protein
MLPHYILEAGEVELARGRHASEPGLGGGTEEEYAASVYRYSMSKQLEDEAAGPAMGWTPPSTCWRRPSSPWRVRPRDHKPSTLNPKPQISAPFIA